MARPEDWRRYAFDRSGRRVARLNEIYGSFIETRTYRDPSPSSDSVFYISIPLLIGAPERMVEIPIWPDLER